MGNPDREESRGLTLLILGVPDQELFASLSRIVPGLHLGEVPLAPDALLEDHPEVVNRAIDEARTHWVLIVRPGERIGDALAREIIESAVEPPVAWGFRMDTDLLYRGNPLRIGRGKGEVRLLHRRHARFDLRAPGTEIKVQGTVLRMKQALARQTYGSASEHRKILQQRRVPQSLARQVLLFCRRATSTGYVWPGANTLRYLWIEAGYDSGGRS